MSARIIDGKARAERLLAEIRDRVAARVASGRPPPGLAVVMVGDDAASKVYVRNKRRAVERIGFAAHDHDLPSTTSQAELMALIDRLNADPSVHGILVQLPLPPHMDATALIQRIRPDKDVDGFHPENLGRLAMRQPGLRPCTPKGVMVLLAHTDRMIRGLDACVVGASNHVGRPMALELLLAGCTTTCCHRFTRNLREHVSSAELLVVAVGKPGLVRGEWVKPGAIVIDIGINRLPNGELAGDVDFEGVRQVASLITPVPGGVGPMTIAMLLHNTVRAARRTLDG